MPAARLSHVRQQLSVRLVRRHVHAGAIHRRVLPAEAKRNLHREGSEARRHITVCLGARRILLRPVYVWRRRAARTTAMCAAAGVLSGRFVTIYRTVDVALRFLPEVRGEADIDTAPRCLFPFSLPD